MTKTYILGAGSSVDFGYPLGCQIFKKAEELAYSPQEKAKSENARHLLRSFANVQKGLKKIFSHLPDDCDHWPNFEELYSFISHELKMPSGPRVAGISESLLVDLRSMLFHMIALCGFKPLLDEFELFEIYRDYFRHVITMEDSVKIISFNYDVLLPCALERINCTPKYSFDCYDINTGRIINFQGTTVDIVIPHGALNIAECEKCDKKYFATDPFTSMIKNKRAICPCCDISLSDSYLIPPSYEKYIDDNNDIEQIINFITCSNEIFIIGYSFPPYDYYFKYLFQFGLAQNPNNPKVEIIDCCPGNTEIEKKYHFLKPVCSRISFFNDGFLNYLTTVLGT